MIEKELKRIADTLDMIYKSMAAISTPPMLVDVEPQQAEKPGNITPITTKTKSEPEPIPSDSPFDTPQEMQTYAKDSYKDLGEEKGKEIIRILKDMGVPQIKDLQPTLYKEFYQKVEALKAS